MIQDAVHLGETSVCEGLCEGFYTCQLHPGSSQCCSAHLHIANIPSAYDRESVERCNCYLQICSCILQFCLTFMYFEALLLGVVQKRVNIVGLRLLSLQRSPCWPLPCIWEVGFRKVSHHSLYKQSALLFLNCPNNMFHVKHLWNIDRHLWKYLSFWESEILVHAGQTAPMWPAPNRNLGHCVTHDLPWQTAFHLSCHDLLLTAQIMCLSWERTLGSLHWFPPDVTQGTFSPGVILLSVLLL